MKIEKREPNKVEEKADTLEGDWLTPKTVALMLSGLTVGVTISKKYIWVDTPKGFQALVLRCKTGKRTSKVNKGEALAVRDALILLGGVFVNTTTLYLKENDLIYRIMTNGEDVAPSGHDLLVLKDVIGDHIDSMGMELRTSHDHAGVAVVSKALNSDE